MPIRLEHKGSPGVAGLAGFAAGRGRARERQRKYAMDLQKEQQRLLARQQEQLQGFKYRTALEGARQQAMQQRQLQQQEFLAGQAEQKRTWETEDIGREQEFRAGQAELGRQHALDMQVEKGLQSGDLVLSPFAQQGIQQARDEYADAAASGKYTAEQLEELRQKAMDRIRNLKRVGASRPEAPSVGAEVSRTLGRIDPKTGQFVTGGAEPTHQAVDGKLVPLPETPQQERAAAETEKMAEEQEKLQAKYQEDMEKWNDLVREWATGNREGYEGLTPEEAKAKAEEELAPYKPTMPAIGTAGTAGPQEVEFDPVAGARKPQPAGGMAGRGAVGAAGAAMGVPGPAAQRPDPYAPPPAAEVPADPAMMLPMSELAPPVQQEPIQVGRRWHEPAIVPRAEMRERTREAKRRPREQAVYERARQKAAGRQARLGARGRIARAQIGPVQIQSQSEYEQLPSGAEFIGPDGKRRRKP